MNVFCSGDWHLDWSTGGYPRRDDVERSAGQVLDAAAARAGDLFVFLGDLCDPSEAAAYRSIAFALMFAGVLKRAGVRSLWLTGNHDVTEDGVGTSVLTPLAAAGHELIARPAVLTHEGVRVVCLPYTPACWGYDPREVVREFASARQEGKYAGPVLVVGHLNVEGITLGSETKEMPRGREVFYPVEECHALLPDAVLVNGHYHHAQEFRGVRHPGSLQWLTFGESNNATGYLVVRYNRIIPAQ